MDKLRWHFHRSNSSCDGGCASAPAVHQAPAVHSTTAGCCGAASSTATCGDPCDDGGKHSFFGRMRGMFRSGGGGHGHGHGAQGSCECGSQAVITSAPTAGCCGSAATAPIHSGTIVSAPGTVISSPVAGGPVIESAPIINAPVVSQPIPTHGAPIVTGPVHSHGSPIITGPVVTPYAPVISGQGSPIVTGPVTMPSSPVVIHPAPTTGTIVSGPITAPGTVVTGPITTTSPIVSGPGTTTTAPAIGGPGPMPLPAGPSVGRPMPKGTFSSPGTVITPGGATATPPKSPETIKSNPKETDDKNSSSRPVPPVVQPTAARVETGAANPFDLSRRYEARVGHAADYSRLTGQLFYVHIDGGVWVLRYAPLSTEDANGGSVILARDSRMNSYREGDLVAVEGRIASRRATPRMGAPLYQVREISLVDRPR